jgi:5-methyltetrahydrofolate--homocysteine methyltransferase
MLIIAERINASRKYIAEAISSQNAAFIQGEAKAQDQAGADFIDVNAGTFVGKESEKLQWIIETVQAVTEKPLCIDSPDPAVIKEMLPLAKKKPMINSITLEPERLQGMVRLVAEYKTRVIALCQSEDAIAETAEDKLRMSEQIVNAVTAAGIPLDNLYIDPLVSPLSTNTQSALATLEAIQRIMKEFPGVHTTCGLTDVSYGLPCRKLINRAFLMSAVTCGLDSVILDPTDQQLLAALKAVLAVNGKDEFCMNYVTAFREGTLE